MKKIVLDVFAADTPELLIKGAADAVNRFPDVTLVLSGAEDYLQSELKKYDCDSSRIEFHNAPQVIGCDERPSDAILRKRDSSLVAGIMRTKSDPEVIGMISGGSTGALIAGCAAFLGRLPGVMYPSLATFLPSKKGRYVCMLDCGALVDCKPEQLRQFAALGSTLITAYYGDEKPVVGLLNVGTEKGKGNALTHAAYELISELPVNFTGNIEAREVLTGDVDVIVCDGFAGNMVLKSIEGSALFTVDLLLNAMRAHLDAEKGKIRDIAGEALKVIDLSTLKGAMLLGVAKPVVKMHGNATDRTIPNVVEQVITLHEGRLVEKTKDLLNNII